MSYLAASVDSITDYNEFSPRRSREVDRATFLFNCIISLMYISILQAEYSLTEVLK